MACLVEFLLVSVVAFILVDVTFAAINALREQAGVDHIGWTGWGESLRAHVITVTSSVLWLLWRVMSELGGKQTLGKSVAKIQPVYFDGHTSVLPTVARVLKRNSWLVAILLFQIATFAWALCSHSRQIEELTYSESSPFYVLPIVVLITGWFDTYSRTVCDRWAGADFFLGTPAQLGA